MRIVIIGHKYVPSREGGVEIVVDELATRMAKLGHKVTLFNRKRKEYKKITEYNGCKVEEVMKVQLMEYGIGVNEVDDSVFKVNYDTRITRLDIFLRKKYLDELPQLWDVFIGKISVVGPRLQIEEFEVAEYTPYQMNHLKVKGGLLCLWQIQKNCHNISFNDKVALTDYSGE